MIDPTPHASATVELGKKVATYYKNGATFEAARELARSLGVGIQGSCTSFLLWWPELDLYDQAHLELLIAKEPLFFNKSEQMITFDRHLLKLQTFRHFAWGVFEEIPSGNEEGFGAFYQFLLRNGSEETRVGDPLADSLPYGIYAPAEVYDTYSVLEKRSDAGYFQDVVPALLNEETGRQKPPVNMLEIHPSTATADGTIQGLTTLYKRIAEKKQAGKKLTIFEQNFDGFDAIQLMPEVPVIENPERHSFWKTISSDTAAVSARLRKPSVTNWGYDIPIFGSTAVNPSILSTGRPHELLRLIETLHQFPGQPIRVVIDNVFGHADNQGLNLLPSSFFSGPNMYGQDLKFRHPMVRSILLEMLHRKMNWGIDGIRVDGAQDFKYYDEKKGEMAHDDDLLHRMGAQTQTVAGIDYLPWMVYEDGRPWPREDWELASTYRDLIKQNDEYFQWAPMIFAYNTPYLFTFWMSKWWRVLETKEHGGRWISGYANHDTMRRGTQTDPSTVRLNSLLGDGLKQIMDHAYNNPATTLFFHGFMPGVPMEFVQALCNTSWSFFRNTDTTYALKVAAEESFFIHWQVNEEEYSEQGSFKQLKALGFHSLETLRECTYSLIRYVDITNYDIPKIAALLNDFPAHEGFEWTPEKLDDFAFAWMNDVHDYCNAERQIRNYSAEKSDFNRQVRRFRLANPWLRDHFQEGDVLDYLQPVEGSVIYYGYRKDRESGKELVFMANMEGQPRKVVPAELPLPTGSAKGWKPVLYTPGVTTGSFSDTWNLKISRGVMFERIPE
ncbi:MAG: glucosylglycerol hydrolase [Balneolaceae bacterium]